MRRRNFISSLSVSAVACFSGCTSSALATTAFSPRLSADEVPSTDPIFKSEEGLDLKRKEAAAFLANSKGELREQMIAESSALETWEGYQSVAFLTAISVVPPIRSSVSFISVDISDETLYMDLDLIPEQDDDSGELGYHRMMLYWTEDYPIANEPTEIQLRN